jgi:hypothetical protein
MASDAFAHLLVARLGAGDEDDVTTRPRGQVDGQRRLAAAGAAEQEDEAHASTSLSAASKSAFSSGRRTAMRR